LYCEVDECGTELSPGTGSQGGLMICTKCRASKYYWTRKGNEAVKERQVRLGLWTNRMNYLAPYIGRVIRQAKAKVAAARERVMHH
jgi:hypothetical protein